MCGARCFSRASGLFFFAYDKEFEGRPGGVEGVEVSAEFGVGDEEVDAGIVKDVSHFVRLQEIVDRHDYCPGVQDAEERGDEFRAVLEPKPDASAGLNAKLLRQALRDQPRLVPNLGVRILAVAPEEGGFVLMFSRGCREGAGQIHAVKYYVRC